jgi:hypothetical protein
VNVWDLLWLFWLGRLQLMLPSHGRCLLQRHIAVPISLYARVEAAY